jgi:hypothetical protein
MSHKGSMHDQGDSTNRLAHGAAHSQSTTGARLSATDQPDHCRSLKDGRIKKQVTAFLL